MKPQRGWLPPENVEYETTCIKLQIPANEAYRAAFWGAITALQQAWNWDTKGDQEKAEGIATYWRHLLFEQLTEDCEDCDVDAVLDMRITNGMLEYTYDGETWVSAGALPTGPSGASVEMREYFGTLQWREVGSEVWNHLINLSEIAGPQGEAGPSGASVEMREYFGTLQWREVGSEVWNHLINLSEITGPQGEAGPSGASVEMREYFDTLQWREVGSSVWNHLINLSEIAGPQGEMGLQGPQGEAGPQGPAGPQGDCECGDEGLLWDNSAQSRCGTAVVTTAYLREIYQRVKLNPNAWDEIQEAAVKVAEGGAVMSSGAVIAGWVLGTGAVLTGVGLIGGGLAIVGGFVGGIIGLTNDNSDQFTPARAEYLEQGLYCILTRRETAEITLEALREWVSYIVDAGFPDADRDIILSCLGFVPISYWRGEAAVAPPKINPCSEATCPTRDANFVYQFTGQPQGGHMRFKDAVAASMMSVVTGIRNEDGIKSAPGMGNTRSFNIRVQLGRIVQLHGVEIEVAHNQTRAADSTVVTLAATGISEFKVVSGIDAGFTDLSWVGNASVSEFSISGTIATAGDFDEDAYLDLFRLKICGYGHPSFGAALIYGDPCEVEEPEPDFCSDIVFVNPAITGTRCFDFRESTHGWTVLTDVNGPWGTYVPGVGFQSLARRNNPGPFVSDVVQIFPPNDWVLGCALASVAVEFSFQRWTAQGVDFPGAGGISMPPVGRIHIDGAAGMEAANGIAIYENVAACPHNSHLGFRAWAGYSYSIRPNTGNVIIHSIKIGFNGNFMPTGGK